MLKIKELRKELGKSQMQVALDLNIPTSTFQQYEYGTYEPSLEVLVGIADYFTVTVDYLIGRTPVRAPLETEDQKLAYQLRHLKNRKAVHAAMSLLEEVKELPGESPGKFPVS